MCRPGTTRERLSSLARTEYRMSLTREDLPEPETPVTAVSTPSGKETSCPVRLFARGATTFSIRSLSTGRRTAGTGISSSPER